MKNRVLPIACLAAALSCLAITPGFTSGGSEQEAKTVPPADNPLPSPSPAASATPAPKPSPPVATP